MKRRIVPMLLALLGVAGTLWCFSGSEPTAAEVSNARRRLDDGVLRAVVLGDSVAHGAGDENGLGLSGHLNRELRPKASSALAVVNLGINGARTGNVSALLDRADSRSQVATADIIVISLGGNDLYGDSRARLLSRILPRYQRERTGMRIGRLVRFIQRINPAAQIYLLGLYNPYRRSPLAPWIDTQVNLWDGGLIQRVASNRKVTVVRIADLLALEDRISPIDRFHPGSRGYSAIARRIAETF